MGQQRPEFRRLHRLVHDLEARAAHVRRPACSDEIGGDDHGRQRAAEDGADRRDRREAGLAVVEVLVGEDRRRADPAGTECSGGAGDVAGRDHRQPHRVSRCSVAASTASSFSITQHLGIGDAEGLQRGVARLGSARRGRGAGTPSGP